MADKSKMPKDYGVYASGLTDASGTPFASIQIRRGTKDVPSFERRQVYVGDTLPQGNVTGITAEGITVIPDEGDEYLLPLGSGARVDYSGRKKTPKKIDLDAAPILNQIDFDADALADLAEDAGVYETFKDQMRPFYEYARARADSDPQITEEDTLREIALLQAGDLFNPVEKRGSIEMKAFPEFSVADLPYIEPLD
jgi:hypothetical protein